MKPLFSLALFFLVGNLFVFGQDYNYYTLNFPKPSNLKEVVMTYDCHVCDPKTSNDTSRVYKFGTNGKVTQVIDYGQGKIQGYIDLKYDSNGNLESSKDYGRWQYSYNEVTKDWDIATWKIETVIAIESYTYVGDKVATKNYYYGPSQMTLYDLNITYDDSGRILKELKTMYPDPNVIATFDSNTTNINGTGATQTDNLETSFSKFISDTLLYTCTKNGTLTGYVKRTYNNQNQLTSEINTDQNGKILNSKIFVYDLNGLLIEKQLTDTGVDSFGNMYDYSWADNETYTYDSNGYLLSISTFAQGKAISTQKFLYTLK